MHVQLYGSTPQRVILRRFEQDLLCRKNPFPGALVAFQALPEREQAIARKAAVRRSERQRRAICKAMGWEG